MSLSTPKNWLHRKLAPLYAIAYQDGIPELRPKIANRLLLVISLAWLSGCEQPELPPSEPPYPQSDLKLEFDWSSHQRLAPGSDNWAITWASNDSQIATWGDGGGFGGQNRKGRVSLGVATISGELNNMVTSNTWGGYQPANEATFEGKSYGIIEVDKILYLWVSPGSNANNYKETRLARSFDGGASWEKADWSFSQDDGMVIPAFLQAGPGYTNSPHSPYVFIYFIELSNPDKLTLQKPGAFTLARAPKGNLFERTKYEFFAGIDDNQAPVWSSNHQNRIPVFNDPSGVGWTLSVSYNKDLSRYFLLTEHTESFRSNLAVFESTEPWGPWQTVYYDKLGRGHIDATAFYYNFSNKWSSDDNFVLVFSGIKANDSWNTVKGRFVLASEGNLTRETTK